MRDLKLIILPLILFSSCQNATETNYLKDRVGLLEQRVDSLQLIIQTISASQVNQPIKKKASKANKTNLASKKTDTKVLSTPANESLEKNSYVAPVPVSRSYTPNKNLSTSSQCMGITKKGARCKRTVRGGGYCWQH